MQTFADWKYYDWLYRGRWRQFAFSFFSGFSKTLHSLWVFGDIDTALKKKMFKLLFLIETSNLFLEFSNKMFQESIIEIFTTQECVTICWTNFEHVRLHFKNRDIKSTTTKIINSNTTNISRNNFTANSFCWQNDDRFSFYILSFDFSRP